MNGFPSGSDDKPAAMGANAVSVRVRDLTLIAIFAVLAIVGGRLVIPLGVIPITLQTAVVLITGFLIGGKRAMAAQGLYVLMGLLGLPVFAEGGGFAYVLRPSFGFLLGMIAAAALVGVLADRADPTRIRLGIPVAAAVAVLGIIVIYLAGLVGFVVSMRLFVGREMTWSQAWRLAILPFLLKDLTVTAMVVAVAPLLRRVTAPFFRS